MTNVLSIEDLVIDLPLGADRHRAVDSVSLTISAGRTLCIVGESGSGKSVMAGAVMGLLPAALRRRSGRIVLSGEDITAAPPKRLRALRGTGMGMVFQEPMTALNPILTCGAQVEELLRRHTAMTAGERRAMILHEFERVCLPDPARIYASYPHQLSGGQRQRIVIAIATILKPALLICDEPTTALDVTTQHEILKLIAGMQRENGQAVMFITHDMGVVAEIADDVLVMRSGTAVEFGTQSAVLRSPQHPYTRMLLDRVPDLTPRPARVLPGGEPKITVQDLTRDYSRSRGPFRRRQVTRALDAASLTLAPGEAVGIVGESGSGKSTLARCIARIIDPGSGVLRWGSQDVATLPENRLRPLRQYVQVIFQDPNRSLNPRRMVGLSMIEGAVNFGMTPQAAMVRAAELMRQVGLPEAGLHRYPAQFSGGQRQRLAIARALACQPEVLIADEAVSALDVSVQAEVIELLRDVQRSHNLSLLFITHDLRVAAQLCDRIIVMHQGKIVETGDTARVFAAPAHDYTRRLLDASPAFQKPGSTAII